MTRYFLIPLLLSGMLLTGQQGCETDADEDDWLACTAGEDPNGGTCDCNDADDSINPDAEEVCEDGVDQNCDGVDDECPDTPTPEPTPLDPLGCVDVDLESAIGDEVYSGILAGATGDSRGSCGGTGNEVALLFSAPERAIYTFDTIGSAIDTVLYVNDETCQGRELECNDDAAGFASSLSVDLRRGQTVVVFIDSYATDNGGAVVLNINPEAEPTPTPTDTPIPTETPTPTATATPTAGDPVGCVDHDLGNDVGASVYTGTVTAAAGNISGSCGGNGNEVVFRWEAPASGEYQFDTFGTSYDTVIYAREGGCRGDQIACNDDTGGLQSSISATFEEGDVILIFADAYSTTSGGGTLNLNITPPDGVTPTPSPTEEPTATATPSPTDTPEPTPTPDPLACVDVELGEATGEVYNAPQASGSSGERGSCGGNGNETIFHWTAPLDGEYAINSFGTSFDTVLYVREGACNGDQVACNDDSSGLQSQVTFTASAGHTYVIFLDSYSTSSGGTAVLNIIPPEVSTPTPTEPPTHPPAPEDTLCIDYDLGIDTGVAVFEGSIENEVGTDSGSCGGDGNELHLLWLAPEAGTYYIDTLGSTSTDTVLYARAGGCDGVQLACNDDAASGVYQSSIEIDVQRWDYVTIVIDTFDNLSYGDVTLSITQ